MGKFDSILESAADYFDLPGEIAAGLPRITVTGCSRVYIENHGGLVEYGDTGISVSGGRAVIRIRGSGLELRAMNSSELLITGKLEGLDFVI